MILLILYLYYLFFCTKGTLRNILQRVRKKLYDILLILYLYYLFFGTKGTLRNILPRVRKKCIYDIVVMDALVIA